MVPPNKTWNFCPYFMSNCVHLMENYNGIWYSKLFRIITQYLMCMFLGLRYICSQNLKSLQICKTVLITVPRWQMTLTMTSTKTDTRQMINIWGYFNFHKWTNNVVFGPFCVFQSLHKGTRWVSNYNAFLVESVGIGSRIWKRKLLWCLWLHYDNIHCACSAELHLHISEELSFSNWILKIGKTSS